MSKTLVQSSERKKLIKKASDQVKEASEQSLIYPVDYSPPEGNFNILHHTGSTLLDLAISGWRVRGGGIPGGILAEFFGVSGSGKTAILCELAADAQIRGGDPHFQDAEARLDKSYTEVYGFEVSDSNISRPTTVEEMFDWFYNFEPKELPKGVANLICTDSLAALSTELEMTKGDKMGMKRAKEFSGGFRKICTRMREENWIIAASNQIRQGDYGDIAPGGNAIGFYSSLRVQIKYQRKKYITKEVKFGGSKYEKTIGIKSECKIVKSSIDDPYRTAPIWIEFGYGIDDISANLQWKKDVLGHTKYTAPDGKEYQSLRMCRSFVEKHNMENDLKEEIISLWTDREKAAKENRKKKKRGIQ